MSHSHDQRIHHSIGTHADRAPEAVAIVAPGRPPLTYGRLARHIDEVAATLNAVGVDRNDRVALVLPQGPEAAVAVIAVAAGAICAPLNPAHRANEFDRQLATLKARALIVPSETDSPARATAEARRITLLELRPAIDWEAVASH